MKHLIWIIMVSCGLGSCNDVADFSTSANDFYHLKIDNAYLPVMVRGNTQSKVILLFVQGGPGYPSIDFASIDYPKWKNSVEKDFAIAYYDQRGFGNKQGNTDLSTITIKQYLKDILAIAQFLKARYSGTKVILFGHSFGGELGYHYLANHEEKGAVDGFISICGPYTHDGENVELQRWGFRRDYLINVSDIFIGNNSNISFWQEAKNWAIATDVIDGDAEQLQWNKYVRKAEKFTEGEIGLKAYLKIAFASPYNMLQHIQFDLNDKISSALIKDEQRYDLSTELYKIDLPVLIIAARFDDQAPAEELEFIYDNITSPGKQFHLFQNAGHNVFLDEPAAFRELVRDFCLSIQ